MKISNIENIYLVSTQTKSELSHIFSKFKIHDKSYNIPDYTMEHFKHQDTKYLTSAELSLVSHFKNISSPYFVIGSIDNDIETTNHEIAHAMYYLNSSYKKEVEDILIPHVYMLRSLKNLLLEKGYDSLNLLDEINSYILFDKEFLEEKSIWNIELSLLSSKLSKIFYNYLSSYSNLSKILLFG